MSEQEAFEAWFRGEQGKPYDGAYTFAEAAWHAALAWLRSQGEAVLWQFRWYDTHPHTATSGQWSEWEEAKPRNPYTDTVLDKVREIQGYIDTGFKYELRPLFLAPQPAIPNRVVNAISVMVADAMAQAAANGANSISMPDEYVEVALWLSKLPDDTDPQPAIPDGWQSVAARDVLSERRRQMEKEGWTLANDDEHRDGSMAQAAACYALGAATDNPDRHVMDRFGIEGTPYHIHSLWPWDRKWFKPHSRRRDLVKAGALILAEIERLDRRMLAAAPEPSK